MKKVNITKEKLTELYTEKKLTMYEIAEIYNVDRSTIGNKLKAYGICSNPSKRKFYHLKAIPLTQQQKELIVGSALGDASIIKRNTISYFKVSHCERQKEYLMWKKEILGNFVNVVNKYADKRGNSIMYSFNTLGLSELNSFRDMFYNNNKKTIKEEISDSLTTFGLAVWYMDDGSKQNNSCRLSTDGFSKDENIVLQKVLKSKFDLDCKVCGYTRNNKEYYFLSFNKNNTIKLHNMIKDYVVNCMKYKLIDCSSTTTCQNSDNSIV